MSAPPTESSPPPRAAAAEHASFFRQSGWLMIANVAGGLLMYAVHFFAKVIPEHEYAIFGALLALTICVPQVPLQMMCARQTAAALATGRTRQLAGMFRAAWFGVTALWALFAVGMLLAQDWLLARWSIAHPAALWVTLLVILAQIWLPMFLGLLQGKQDFLPYGWAMILNGVGRLAFAALIVVVLAARGAAGLMTGALAGLLIAAGIALWAARDLWSGRGEPFDARAQLRQVVPLLLGFGACQFLMAADTMIVNAFLKQNAECYVAAGTLSRALIWAVGPLTAVMFPRIVHSTVRGEKSNVFGLSLAFTAGLAIVGVLGLWLLGPWVVRVMAKPSYVAVTTQLLPWYAGAMVPLCLANVLASNLLGKADFRPVLPMVLLAAAYGVTLLYVHGSFLQVLQLLALFNFLLFAVCGWYTLRPAPARAAATG
jgi:O-antigen/teichoic acid export membrane protein